MCRSRLKPTQPTGAGAWFSRDGGACLSAARGPSSECVAHGEDHVSDGTAQVVVCSVCLMREAIVVKAGWGWWSFLPFRRLSIGRYVCVCKRTRPKFGSGRPRRPFIIIGSATLQCTAPRHADTCRVASDRHGLPASALVYLALGCMRRTLKGRSFPWVCSPSVVVERHAVKLCPAESGHGGTACFFRTIT